MSSNSLPTIYIKPGCPWCNEALAFLKKNGIKVQERDVIADADARGEMLRLSGQTKAPTMDWNGKILADFGVDELKPFLTQQGVKYS